MPFQAYIDNIIKKTGKTPEQIRENAVNQGIIEDDMKATTFTKAGLHAYTKSIRVQLKGTTVKVFELAPPKTSAPLFNRNENSDAHQKQNRMPTMTVPKVASVAIHKIQKNEYEILPGLSKLLKLVGRFQL